MGECRWFSTRIESRCLLGFGEVRPTTTHGPFDLKNPCKSKGLFRTSFPVANECVLRQHRRRHIAWFLRENSDSLNFAKLQGID